MRSFLDMLFKVLLSLLVAATVLSLAFVLYFVVSEALPTFADVSLEEFLFTSKWMPIAFTGETNFGIFNFIAGTLYVSFLALAFAIVVGLGAAVFLSCCAPPAVRQVLYPLIDLLAGVPSVVYGFVGLMVVVRLFMTVGVDTGSCILAAAVVLAVMLLPYIVSSCGDTLTKAKNRYLAASNVLGVSKWYAIAEVILPASWRNIFLSFVLAIGRALGETMAVMMVVGNANLFPSLLGKGETIAALITLEMGTAEVGSTHYHALYAAGLVLLVCVLLVQGIIVLLRKKLMR